jgi:hypothetical protein
LRVLAPSNAAIRLSLLLSLLIPDFSRAATPSPLPDSVLASVGRRVVTRAEFLRQWRRLAPPAEPAGKSLARRKHDFLDELVNKEALSMATQAARFVPTPADSQRLSSERVILARQEYYRRMVLDSLPPPDTSSHAGHGGHAGHGTHGADPASAEREVERRLIERHVAPLSPSFDDSTAVLLARAFAKLPDPYEEGPGWLRFNYTSWMPPVAARDTSRVLGRSTLGPFTVGRFLWFWSQIPASQRDRPDRLEAVVEWTKSFLAQGSIDAEARRMGHDRLPEVEAKIIQDRQIMALEAYYQSNVLTRVDTSETRLRALWQKNPRRFDGSPSSQYYAVWYGSRDQAQIAYHALTRGASWDSLLSLRFPAGATEEENRIVRSESEPYRLPQTLLEGSTDSTLSAWFATAHAGQTFGPRERAGQWWIYRFVEHRDGKRSTYAEARPYVVENVLREDGEALLRRHFRELRARYGVRINEPALANLDPDASP